MRQPAPKGLNSSAQGDTMSPWVAVPYYHRQQDVGGTSAGGENGPMFASMRSAAGVHVGGISFPHPCGKSITLHCNTRIGLLTFAVRVGHHKTI